LARIHLPLPFFPQGHLLGRPRTGVVETVKERGRGGKEGKVILVS